MRGVPGWALKTGAIGLTVVVTVASASYVGAHVRDRSAPLRPPVRPNSSQVTLAPGMRTTSSEPVTETVVS